MEEMNLLYRILMCQNYL